MRRGLGDRHGIAWSLHYLGRVAADRGEYGRALALDRESLELRRELGDRRGIAGCLEGLANVAGRTGQPERAARLLGAAGALRETLHAPLAPDEARRCEQDVAATRSALGSDAFAAAWAAGQVLSAEEAMDCALDPVPSA